MLHENKYGCEDLLGCLLWLFQNCKLAVFWCLSIYRVESTTRTSTETSFTTTDDGSGEGMRYFGFIRILVIYQFIHEPYALHSLQIWTQLKFIINNFTRFVRRVLTVRFNIFKKIKSFIPYLFRNFMHHTLFVFFEYESNEKLYYARVDWVVCHMFYVVFVIFAWSCKL